MCITTTKQNSTYLPSELYLKNASKDFIFNEISFIFKNNNVARIIHCFNFLNSKALKQITKTLVAIGGALLITGGAVVNFLQARKPPLTPQEELTLANIEALAIPPELGEDGKCPNGFRRFTIVDNISRLCHLVFDN